MGLLTFAVPNYKTVLGTKISFRGSFRKSVMFGLCFPASTGGGGWGGVLKRGSTSSRVTQYCVHNICRFT